MKNRSPLPAFLRTSSQSREETLSLAAKLAPALRAGDVILLLAGLGCGKTTFVQGVASTMRVKEDSLSPTFVLARTLKAKYLIHHLDFYRLKKEEVWGYGLEDYLTGKGEIPKGIVFIEWADRCKEIWPKERLEIHIKMEPKTRFRQFVIKGTGPRYTSLVHRLKVAIQDKIRHGKSVLWRTRRGGPSPG